MQATGNPSIIAPDEEGLTRAAACLAGGGLVAVPTETVYGLAARADRAEAVAAIYAAKGRPDFNPLIVHVATLEAARRIGVFGALATRLAGVFWPGALTLVVPLSAEAMLAPAVTAGLPSVALRCPAHPVMQAVLKRSGLPLAAPSANRSGAISPTSAEHVAASLSGRAPLILDGGATANGIESTIVAIRADERWELLRPGPVSAERIAAVAGSEAITSMAPGRIEAPGQLSRHYAPGKPLRLDADRATEDEFLIGFGPVKGDLSLSPDGDLPEAAARLYACLHEAVASPLPRIAVAPVPRTGIGVAINDRLRRAAA